MSFTKAFFASAIVGVLLAASSQAAPIAISNADFEANGPGFVQATDWTPGTNTARVADHASFRNESATYGGGLHFAFTQGTTGAAEQTLAATYAAGTNYTLGANVNYGGSDFGVDGIFELGYDPGTGFVSLGSTTIDLEALNAAHTGVFADGTNWPAVAADAVSGNGAVGENIIIRINSSMTQGLWFDNVTLDAVVPEPATFALLGFGLLGVAASRRRVA